MVQGPRVPTPDPPRFDARALALSAPRLREHTGNADQAVASEARGFAQAAKAGHVFLRFSRHSFRNFETFGAMIARQYPAHGFFLK